MNEGEVDEGGHEDEFFSRIEDDAYALTTRSDEDPTTLLLEVGHRTLNMQLPGRGGEIFGVKIGDRRRMLGGPGRGLHNFLTIPSVQSVRWFASKEADCSFLENISKGASQPELSEQGYTD
ncbi:unnamed protein product [Amoebophrya sp. A25]|nr:unnamed protein product [Amoebophrya sp. A25]|eukprot:GSA25T00015380001.1